MFRESEGKSREAAHRHEMDHIHGLVVTISTKGQHGKDCAKSKHRHGATSRPRGCCHQTRQWQSQSRWCVGLLCERTDLTCGLLSRNPRIRPLKRCMEHWLEHGDGQEVFAEASIQGAKHTMKTSTAGFPRFVLPDECESGSNQLPGSGEHSRHPRCGTTERKRHNTDPNVTPFRSHVQRVQKSTNIVFLVPVHSVPLPVLSPPFVSFQRHDQHCGSGVCRRFAKLSCMNTCR